MVPISNEDNFYHFAATLQLQLKESWCSSRAIFFPLQWRARNEQSAQLNWSLWYCVALKKWYLNPKESKNPRNIALLCWPKLGNFSNGSGTYVNGISKKESIDPDSARYQEPCAIRLSHPIHKQFLKESLKYLEKHAEPCSCITLRQRFLNVEDLKDNIQWKK